MLVLKKRREWNKEQECEKPSLQGFTDGGGGGEGVVGGVEGGVLDLSLSSVIQGFPTTVTVP